MRWAWLLVALSTVSAWGKTDYRLLTTQRWNTVADGPLGGVVVDDDAPLALTRAVKRPRVAPPWFRMLQRRGLLPANQPLPATPENVLHRRAGRLLTPDLDRRQSASGKALGDPTNRLTFDFAAPSGDPTAVAWSTTQQQALSNYLTSAEAEILRVWGAPAFANTVRIVHDPELNSTQMAVYDATRNELRVELLYDSRTSNPATTQIDDYDLYVLTMAVLLAYRDEAAAGFDAWEAGMARAAQLTIINNTKPTFGFLARDYWLLFGHYDILNQPGLEGPSFRGANTSATAETLDEAMATIRAYMCQAAWLKALAERPTLFADFNAQFYAALNANFSVRFSVPALRNLMTALVPQVEGLGFADWYTRQYCFDTALIPGAKLFIFGTVTKDFIANEPTNSFPMSIYHWQTTTNNEARALTGTVHFTYTAFDDYPLNDAVQGASGLGGIECRLGEAGNEPGIGSVVPLFFNIEGNQGVQMQRIVVDGLVNGVARRLFFPNDVAASDQQVRYDLYGLVTNGFQGSLKVDIEGRDSVTTNVVQGAFRARIPGGLPTAARATLTWQPDTSGGSVGDVENRNVMYLGPLGSGVDVANGETVLILDTPPPSYTQLTKTFPAGTSLITVPAFAKRNNLAQILGVPADQLLLARADGAKTAAQPWRNGEIYRLWPNTPPFQPGYGFWLVANAPLTMDFGGVPASRDNPYRLFLPPGWQQIGNPFTDLNLALGGLRLQAPDGTDAISLAQAQTEGLVSSGVFGYTAGSGYTLLTPTSVLTPYAGFWINVISPAGATLIFPNQIATRAPETDAIRRPAEASSWLLRLHARADGLVDAVAGCGVESGAGDGCTVRDVPKPPPFGQYVSVSFPHDDWGARSGRYARDLREPVSGSTSWDVLVESDRAGRQVTLSWPDLARVPGDLSLVLTDLTSGAQRFLRSSASYTFTAAATGNRFRLTASRALLSRLSIVSLAVQPGRGRSGSVSYALSAPASVTMLVFSPAGRLVTSLARGRAADRGAGNLEFPGTDAQGRPLPNGVYRVDLIAVGEDGQQARASRLVVLER